MIEGQERMGRKKKPEKADVIPSTWSNTPEWKRKTKNILTLKAQGFEIDEIMAITETTAMEVRRVVEDEFIALTVARQNFQEKIPLIKEIIGVGLDVIRDELRALLDPEVRAEKLKKITDVAAVSKLVSDLNTLLRLEQGQSTENIATSTKSYQETRHVIQELKRTDPVFDYPELPPSPNESQ
ncbi:MAG: hypothetical protein BWY21_00365 [Parcubacteria group bacterium ADurb.Bin216]|nr:MAG: hypothetical protein BWY21_00365 [Parcubacteria group bacterium ADurb.Bin216]